VKLPFASTTRGRPLAYVVAMLLLPIAASAQTRIGVTSQTDGDPLGRPPAQAERILRVGIDIQANETVTTKADDRAHLVFLDGTALTVSPNARLVIDKFVYDPQTQTGDLALTASAGVFRLVGGKISKVSPIVIKTPSATMGVRGGIGMFTVTPGQTTADFLYGKSMTVQASGQTQIATRPSTMIVTRLGAPPGAPTLIPNGALAQAVAALETQTGGKSMAADEKAKQSGFSASNSGQTLIPNQITSNLSSQINNATEAVATVTQQRDIQTTQPATPVSATVPVAPAPPAPSGPPPGSTWCPPTDHHSYGYRQPYGRR
jgi:hypothetical protein